MPFQTRIGIAHSGQDPGKPGEYTRAELDLVKDMIRQVADHSMGGMHPIVRPGQKAPIKINTVKPVDGDVIVVGDCAKSVLERFPNAQYWGETGEYPNCTPIWANRPDVGMVNYVRHLTAVQEGNRA